MKCIICKRDENDIMMMKLPVEAIYESNFLEILGNCEDDEYICLSCIGCQFDDVMEEKENVI